MLCNTDIIILLTVFLGFSSISPLVVAFVALRAWCANSKHHICVAEEGTISYKAGSDISGKIFHFSLYGPRVSIIHIVQSPAILVLV